MNHGSINEHISIYSDLDLIKSFAISVEVKHYSNFNDLIIVGDKLFIAHRNKGLGVFEIKDSYFKASKDKFDNFNNRVKESLINYKKYKKGEIIRLTIIPNTPKIILTIRNSLGDIINEIVEK